MSEKAHEALIDYLKYNKGLSNDNSFNYIVEVIANNFDEIVEYVYSQILDEKEQAGRMKQTSVTFQCDVCQVKTSVVSDERNPEIGKPSGWQITDTHDFCQNCDETGLVQVPDSCGECQNRLNISNRPHRGGCSYCGHGKRPYRPIMDDDLDVVQIWCPAGHFKK